MYNKVSDTSEKNGILSESEVFTAGKLHPYAGLNKLLQKVGKPLSKECEAIAKKIATMKLPWEYLPHAGYRGTGAIHFYLNKNWYEKRIPCARLSFGESYHMNGRLETQAEFSVWKWDELAKIVEGTRIGLSSGDFWV
jgi:hypothetical protein